MRLIDADALKENVIQKYNDTFDMIFAFMSSIDNAPTIDAVPVVQCKDCKHRPAKPDDYNPITTDGFALEFPDEKCPCQCEDGWYSWYPPDDFFCAKGKRKGGDE